MPVYVYCCPERHHTEMVSSYSNRLKVVPCEVCGSQADLILTAPNVVLEGVSGDFPGAAMKWDKKHKKQLEWEKKRQ